MPRFRSAYPPEFRRQMVELVRSERTPEELCESLCRPRSPSPTGFVRPSATPASAAMVRPAPSAKN